jgi:hypothetical protein
MEAKKSFKTKTWVEKCVRRSSSKKHLLLEALIEILEKIFEWIKVFIIAGLFAVAGFLLIGYSENHMTDLKWKAIAEHVGAVLIAVCTLHFVNDLFLRKTFFKRINKAVEESMPRSFKRIRDSGIVDVYQTLSFDSLKKDIDEIKYAEIYFLTLWIPNLSSIYHSLISAVNERECTVKILIYKPAADDVSIEKRAKSIESMGYNEASLRNSIDENVTILKSAFKSINETAKAENRFECKYYDQWISHPIYGLGDTLLIGHYLRNKISTETHYIKVSGNGSTLFSEMRKHFNDMWKTTSEDILAEPTAQTTATTETNQCS